MIIEISDDILKNASLSDSDVKLDFALFLYSKQFLTLEQASNFAGLDSFEFQKFLGKSQIPSNYDINDFREDMETIKKLA